MKHLLAVLLVSGSLSAAAETYCTIKRYDQEQAAKDSPTLFEGVVKDRDAFLFAEGGLVRGFRIDGKQHMQSLMKLHGTPYVLIDRDDQGHLTLQVGHIQYWGPSFMTVAKNNFVTDAAAVTSVGVPSALTVPAKRIGISCEPTKGI